MRLALSNSESKSDSVRLGTLKYLGGSRAEAARVPSRPGAGLSLSGPSAELAAIQPPWSGALNKLARGGMGGRRPGLLWPGLQYYREAFAPGCLCKRQMA